MGTSYTTTTGVGFDIPEDAFDWDAIYEAESEEGYFDYDDWFDTLSNTDGLELGVAGHYDGDQIYYVSVKRLEVTHWEWFTITSIDARNQLTIQEHEQLIDVARQIGIGKPQIGPFSALSVG